MFEPEELFIVENPAWKIEQNGNPLTCIDYSPDGALVAYSNQPGNVTVISSYDGEVKRKLDQEYTNYPVTGCKFHPSEDSLLITTTRDGCIFLYNLVRGELVNMSRHLGSNLLTMNVDSFGEIFAIGCADGSIRIYDIENLQRTKALVKMISRASTSQIINIYSLCFHPEDSNILLSAGWNDKVLFWDIRTGNPERSIAGPHIRGPAVDIHSDMIITGSARDKKQIEIWEFGTGKKVRDINWDMTLAGGNTLINTVKIARNGLDVLAGGSGVNVCQLYDFNQGKVIGQTAPFNSPIVSCSVSPFGSGFVAGSETGEASCQMVRLKPT